MVYTPPQLLVRQQFTPQSAGTAGTRRAHITGPQAALFRYAQAAEKQLCALGSYDPTSDAAFPWPNRPVGALIDLSYVQLFLDNAKLAYYQHVSGSGSGTAVAAVAGRPNRVRSASVGFADNGASYPKSAIMGSRGAVIGDGVIVRGVSGGNQYTLETTIRGFVGEVLAATRGAATGDTANATNQSFATSVDLAGNKNAITVTPFASAYEGTTSGVIDETYTVTCIRGSTGSDPTTALLSVKSLSGTDDATDVVPGAWGGYTTIGSRGLLVQFGLNATNSASIAASAEGISEINFAVGQSWRVRVVEAFVPCVATASGTYTGPANTTYIVTITKGGLFGASGPQFSVTTTTGVETAMPVTVAASNTLYPVGNYGVQISWATGTKLRAGDKYYITVTAQAAGEFQTLVLADDLSAGLQASTELDLTLYYKNNIVVPVDRAPTPPLHNYDAVDAELTVYAGMQVYDPAWVVSGSEAPLSVIGGSMYAQYRAWLDQYTTTIQYAGVDTVSGLLGTVDPDNPLAYAVFLAASNANGVQVGFTGVKDPTSQTSWNAALSLLPGKTGIYSVTPLSSDPAVQAMWLGHALSESSESNKRWRRAVVGVAVPATKAVVSSANTVGNAPVLATLVDDPDAAGTQYRLLIGDANAKFITNGVLGGDQVRYLFGTDGFGNATYTTFIVNEVVSESTLRLTTANPSAITVGQKVEIWRSVSRVDTPAEVQAAIGAFGSPRAIVIANPTITIDGVDQPSYFAAAAFAGLRSGVEPQRPLSRVTLVGFTDIGAMANQWNAVDMDAIAGSGGLIIAKTDAGQMYIRHAVTSAGVNAGLSLFEEMYGSNVDDISYNFATTLEPYYGRANVVPGVINLISAQITATATALSLPASDPTIGPQIISFATPTVRQSETQLDHVVASIALTLPFPLNVLEMNLIV